MWIKASTFLCSYFCGYLLMLFSFGIWATSSFGFLTKLLQVLVQEVQEEVFKPDQTCRSHEQSGAQQSKDCQVKDTRLFFLLLLLSFCWPFSFGAGPIQEQAHRPVLIKAAPPQLPLCSRTLLQLESCIQWLADFITRLFSFSASLWSKTRPQKHCFRGKSHHKHRHIKLDAFRYFLLQSFSCSIQYYPVLCLLCSPVWYLWC